MDNIQVFNDINPTTFHPNDPLQEILRDGARKILQTAIENEVNEYLAILKTQRDSFNRQIATRNGYLPKRTIDTGLGPIPVQQPRVRHRDGGKFKSAILPPYLKRTRSIDAMIPALYLKGISTSDFPMALEAILGKEVKGLSPTNIIRLKECWEQEYKDWLKKDLSEKTYVYIWADGVYFNVRLGDERPCILVIIGALENGRKEILAIHDGQRESKISWKEVIQNLKSRGLKTAPKLAVGDGALGFWSALEEEFPETKQQRCWVHKTANILDKMPKAVQGNAKRMIHEIYMAPRKIDSIKAFETFLGTYESKYPKACECLKKDREQLLAFYDFPAMHWQHIRTTNPIESMFATVRHRTRQTKGCGSRVATLSMVYKLATAAENSWRKLKGHDLIKKVIAGVKFKDGEEDKLENIA